MIMCGAVRMYNINLAMKCKCDDDFYSAVTARLNQLKKYIKNIILTNLFLIIFIYFKGCLFLLKIHPVYSNYTQKIQ